MRRASVMLAIAACAVSSLSLAQRRDPPTEVTSPAATPTATTEAAENSTNPPKSGFGQVMGMLTQLLQEAATRQAQGPDANASHAALSANSAVTINVTPVHGRTTFFTGAQHGNGTVQPATTAGNGIASHLEPNAQLAVQAGPATPTEVDD